MINRNDSQRSNRRPFSSTNPFRNALNDSSLQEYNNDKQFMEWTKNNGVQSPPYLSNSGSRHNSNFSFVDSVEEEGPEDDVYAHNGRAHSPVVTRLSTSPTPIASNNPFLGDVAGEGKTFSTESSISQTSDNRNASVRSDSTRNYPTAREEKDRLRQSYMETSNVNRQSESQGYRKKSSPGNFAPPSYEEAAGTKTSRSQYPREKEHRSHRSNSSHGHSSSGNPHRRSYYPDSDQKRESDRERSRDDSRDSRYRHHSSKSSSSKSKRKNKVVIPKNVDSIDKLDVTGLFGGSFHHDGPFDAVTPHRNKNMKAAPVMAFPADGPNSTIGGASSKPSTLNEVFGRDEYADDNNGMARSKGNVDYRRSVYMGSLPSNSSSTLDAIKNHSDVSQFDPKTLTSKVSGPTTIGLGSTTFLDGAPASKTAIRDDVIQHAHQSRGVQRHKSLSQRFNIGRSNTEISHRHGTSSTTNNSSLNDDDIYLSRSSDKTSKGITFDDNAKKESSGNTFLRRVKSLKVSRK
ncbi:hypothetical protein TPHA_0E01940 [Tetrapisispora phaffii CBS 4417]|uniref:Pal1 cell morphology protein n=1 Tax=Tetrapisispora phaffii (strain ATCC 24235 / CBS 4417 / NBRC 1672 / NRRL Y-8282 / UCD 70-5) TaxID=1071381 RepID=G8BTQ8_TETPH|nr:hypothetical protein TPHA_0E01940 [Tetrapisispora phaffii CBS 4417]CCE63286.1 hypothetical protein TPHA_0E01940 [Tetrapisispora phaffii CBS 4417]